MSSGSHLSKELLELVKSIGESRSKQEEDKIISVEAVTLKQKFQERNISERRMKEYLIRAIYVEMLGHDASYSYIHAVNLTQSKNLLVKKVGYLACSMFIEDNSELVILMISTIQRDLQSKNHLEVLAALTIISKLCNQHILMATKEMVDRLMGHTHEMIRKKALMVLMKMEKVFPGSIETLDQKMKRSLCDKDPQVMAAALNYFCEEAKRRPKDFRDLTNSFLVILKQVTEHRLPRDYDYHRVPAPWVQMKILEILGWIGKADRVLSEQMYDQLNTVLRKADDAQINIGYALVYQCLKTITMIYPSQSLMDTVTTTIARFLSSESHNLKYIGINGLAQVVKIDPKYAIHYQGLVVDCLEDADDTLKIKTLDLLYRMTNKQNVEPIIEKLLGYLTVAPIESQARKDLVIKINSLCDNYSPNKNWYVRTMNRLYEMGGDLITPDLTNQFITSISEYQTEIDGEKFRDATITIYLKILKKNPRIHDAMMQVIAWIMGEYGPGLPDQKKKVKILELLADAAYLPLEDEKTRSYILVAMTKLHAALDYLENPYVDTVMDDYSQSKHVDVQQRAIEYQQLKLNASKLPKEIMMKTPLSAKQLANSDFDFSLSFLDTFVQSQLSNGKKAYDPKKRQIYLDHQAMDMSSSPEKELNFKPYLAPQQARYTQEPTQSQANANTTQNPAQPPSSSAPYQGSNPPPSSKDGLNLEAQNIRRIWGQPGAPIPGQANPAASYYESANNLKIATSNLDSNIAAGSGESQPSRTKAAAKAPEKKKENLDSIFGPLDKNSQSYSSDPKKQESDQEEEEDEAKERKKTKRKKEKKSKRKRRDNEEEEKQEIKEENLLNLDEGDLPSQVEKQPMTLDSMLEGGSSSQQQQQVSDSLADLLDFDPLKTPSTTGQSQQQVPATSLLDDIFSGGSSTSSEQVQSVPTQAVTSLAGDLIQPSTAQSGSKPFTPLQLSTAQFAEFWVQYSHEKKATIVSPLMTSPQVYAGTIKNKLNFHAVDVINNEVIAAGLYSLNGSFNLIHCRLSMGGSLELTVKGNNAETVEMLASKVLPQQLISIF